MLGGEVDRIVEEVGDAVGVVGSNVEISFALFVFELNLIPVGLDSR